MIKDISVEDEVRYCTWEKWMKLGGQMVFLWKLGLRSARWMWVSKKNRNKALKMIRDAVIETIKNETEIKE